ncbi:hypothetical protein HY637_04775 [Candidatus Woesearchaeota archaeon]|nr:hypothetical protein [Candidatus Woesearchaeota archaeon]
MFLLGKTSKTSNWLIGQFNEMGILDGNGNLTEFGIEIQKDLRNFYLNKNARDCHNKKTSKNSNFG